MDTIAGLKKYNRWRRGLDAWHDEASAPSPGEIGQLIDNACDQLERLQAIAQAAELAYGALWMVMHLGEKQKIAKDTLTQALDQQGRARGIQAAVNAGLQADHPSSADHWAGKNEKVNQGVASGTDNTN